MEDYLEGKEISVETLKACIRKGTIDFKFVPVLCGTAFKNKGVQPLLDAVVDYLPSPSDIGFVEGIKEGSDEKIQIPNTTEEPFAALANAAKGSSVVLGIWIFSSDPSLIPSTKPISLGEGR